MEEQQNDKHGPRLDEHLAESAEPMERGGPETGRIEEERFIEPPGTGRPPVDPRDAGERLDHDGVQARSELARHLEPHVFPARREDLLRSLADEPGAEEVLAVVRRLPDDREFANVQDVWEALGGGTDEPV